MSDPIAVLSRSHRHLMDLTETLTAAELRRESYCRDWTIAQVLSHIGSGAEIGTAVLRAVIVGAEPPSRDAYRTIWDRWDASSPEEQRSEARSADAALITLVSELASDSPGIIIPSYRGPVDLPTYAVLRLAEQAVHVWDIEVSLDPTARMDGETAALILSTMAPSVGRLASERVATEIPPAVLAVEGCSEPWRLTVGRDVSLTRDDGEIDGVVFADDDSLLRLVYGRLDPSTTSADVLVRGPVDLDDLRRLFPGF